MKGIIFFTDYFFKNQITKNHNMLSFLIFLVINKVEFPK